jgi:hypothetical protein
MIPIMRDYQVYPFIFNVIMFGFLFVLGACGYGYFTWGQYKIVKKSKLASSSLSDQDQNIVERLKILRHKFLFVYLCFVVASALFVLSTWLHHMHL